MINITFNLIVSLWLIIDSTIFMFVSNNFKYLYLFTFIYGLIEFCLYKKKTLLSIRRPLLFSCMLGYSFIKLLTEYYSGLSICIVIRSPCWN